MGMIKKLLRPVNIFRFLAAANVIIISFYSLGKGDTLTEVTKDRLNSLSQLLLILLFLIGGIEGVKDEDKTKRYLSYFNFSVAIIILVINVLILFKL